MRLGVRVSLDPVLLLRRSLGAAVAIVPLFPADLVSQACVRLAANITEEDWKRTSGTATFGR
jgi:hypothetical protein